MTQAPLAHSLLLRQICPAAIAEVGQVGPGWQVSCADETLAAFRQQIWLPVQSAASSH
jgi:hypothetical protein